MVHCDWTRGLDRGFTHIILANQLFIYFYIKYIMTEILKFQSSGFLTTVLKPSCFLKVSLSLNHT